MENKEPKPEQATTQPCGQYTTPYEVVKGDTFFTIARKFGVSLDVLVAINPQIQDPARINPGDIVCVPKFEDTDEAVQQSEPAQQDYAPQMSGQSQEFTTQQTCPPGSFRYTVQPGDSMWSIAQRFGVSLDALIAANPQIPNPSRIFPGQVVCVPTGPPTVCPPGSTRYTVRPGDSMWLIAQRFGVSLDALIAANPQISDPSRITPGQIVCVPTGPPPPGCPPGTFRYTVRPGDSMWLIAQRFGVSLNALIAANPQISDPSRITPGQVICVPQR